MLALFNLLTFVSWCHLKTINVYCVVRISFHRVKPKQNRSMNLSHSFSHSLSALLQLLCNVVLIDYTCDSFTLYVPLILCRGQVRQVFRG